MHVYSWLPGFPTLLRLSPVQNPQEVTTVSTEIEQVDRDKRIIKCNITTTQFVAFTFLMYNLNALIDRLLVDFPKLLEVLEEVWAYLNGVSLPLSEVLDILLKEGSNLHSFKKALDVLWGRLNWLVSSGDKPESGVAAESTLVRFLKTLKYEGMTNVGIGFILETISALWTFRRIYGVAANWKFYFNGLNSCFLHQLQTQFSLPRTSSPETLIDCGMRPQPDAMTFDDARHIFERLLVALCLLIITKSSASFVVESVGTRWNDLLSRLENLLSSSQEEKSTPQQADAAKNQIKGTGQVRNRARKRRNR